MTNETQSHYAFASTSCGTTQYSYSDAAHGGAAGGDPDGIMKVRYVYGSANGLDDVIGRLENLQQVSIIGLPSTLTLEACRYLGLSTIVLETRAETGVNLTYIGAGSGDAGDKYTGLDRFGGRVVWAYAGYLNDFNQAIPAEIKGCTPSTEKYDGILTGSIGSDPDGSKYRMRFRSNWK